jgi:hypothetical protein
MDAYSWLIVTSNDLHKLGISAFIAALYYLPRFRMNVFHDRALFAQQIDGAMAWTSGVFCRGKVRLHLKAAGLPVSMRFEGTCADQPYRFREVFSFTDPPPIEPPE